MRIIINLIRRDTSLPHKIPKCHFCDNLIEYKKVRTGLHAKVILFDEKDVFVGSFNLGPRSSTINNEGGLYIESPQLAKRVMAYMDEGIDLKKCLSFRSGQVREYYLDHHRRGQKGSLYL